ncbi:response regulator receiver domain [Mesorhizobium sp. VK25A]|uniref:Response regulator receiver domain n=1 Tax=Mesorhizobium vachelliae TaxID=3072309 RepID=A0ABU5A9T1_9HYPH|nr:MULTISPECIES: response regulator receiver domain [unclassified Mesorhizobium]MDX8534464.1 response regulator receiver domain [Mesorhizobium sp. VK25D]MDX8547284.1 response regulator receiver domain [Mesorhizobium sp. VK25A]
MTASNHYTSFIDEAFVHPIRSVLIVDDDYPTIDEMLDTEMARAEGQEQARSKEWYRDPGRIKSVLANLRDKSLLIDIHDGYNVSAGEDLKVAKHLHQSDLLVLDYQLDKSMQGDGTWAIEIIRTLARNNHFNMVVLHTSESIDKVFRQILIGLLTPMGESQTNEDAALATELIARREDTEEGAEARILASIDLDQYIYVRAHPDSYFRVVRKGQAPFSNFHAECQAAGWDGVQERLVLYSLLASIEQKVKRDFSPVLFERLHWSSEGVHWIKSESLFIAFSNKADREDLVSELQAALYAWNPQPSRLLLARIRAEMDELGVLAQTNALSNQHALAHWYKRLLTANGLERRWLIAEAVSRHSERLMGAVLQPVQRFADRLIKAEAHGDAEEICFNHFKVKLADATTRSKAEHEHNAFVCSKEPEGWHLNTGHVFKAQDDYWVCLSPACDMVPAQLSKERRSMFGGRLPFIAVKLVPLREGKSTPVDIQSNRYIFIQCENSVSSFCFNRPEGENSSPDWQTLYADKLGEFRGDFEFDVFITKMGKTRLVSEKKHAKVVGQLRYEYALNLIHRLGASMTRVGLDFTGAPTPRKI